MNSFFSKLVLFQVYYPAIAGFLICAFKSTGIVALGGLAAIALRRRAAAARCWVWRAVLVSCLLLPLFDFGPAAVKRMRLAWPQTLNPESSQAFYEQAKAYHFVEAPERAEARRKRQDEERAVILAARPSWERGASPPVTVDDFRASPWRQIEARLRSIWWAVAGSWVLFAATRTAFGFWRLRKNARKAAPGFQRAAGEVASRLNIKRTPCVWWADRLHSPLMAGGWIPGVYLPAVAGEWDDQRRETVYLHELAHWRRGDHVWLQIGRLMSCVLWWQPLVAWAVRQMNAEAEGAADDVVLLHQTGVEEYATTLVEIASGTVAGAPALGMQMIGYRSLEKRIRALLCENPWRDRMGTFASTAVAVVALISVATASFYVADAASRRTTTGPQEKAVSLSAADRATLERVVANTLKRLGALRFLHFKLEESTRREDADATRISPLPTKMEAWVDEWTGVHRVEYRPRVLVWTHGAAPFSIEDSTAINDGKSSVSYTDYDRLDQVQRRDPEGLEFYLGLGEATDLLHIARVILATSALSGHDVRYTVETVTGQGRSLVQIREQFMRNGNVHQQRTFLVDPSEADMLVSSELVFPDREPERPHQWRLEEIGRTATGVRYPLRYQRISYYDNAKTTVEVKVTQLDLLDALPVGITAIPKPPGDEYVAKNGAPVRHSQLIVSYVSGAKAGEPVAPVTASVRINHRGAVELRTDAQGRLVVPLPNEEITFLDIRAKAAGFAPQVLEWRKMADPLQLPETYTTKLWPGFPISGKVVDEEGNPVKNAEVSFWLSGRQRTWGVFSDRFALSPKAVTNAEGVWMLNDFPEDLGGLGFRASAPGYQATTDSGLADFRSGTGLACSVLRDGSWVLTLKRGAELRGVLTDTNGAPVAGARVVVGTDINGTNAPTGTSGAAGDFSLKGLRVGPITVTVEAPNQKPISMELTLPIAEPLKIRLEPGRMLRGRVVDAAGKPCAGLNVNVDTWKKLRTLDFGTQTDADGRFVWAGAPDEPVTFAFGACQSREFLRDLSLAPKPEEQLIVMKPALRLVASVVGATDKAPLKNVRLTPGRVWSETDITWGKELVRTYPDARIAWESVDVGESITFLIEAEGYEPFQTKTYVANQVAVQETFALKAKSRSKETP